MSATKIAATAAVAVMLLIVLVAAAVGAIASVLTGTSLPDCAPTGSTPAGVASYRPDQMANAATILALGKQLNIPEQGQVVAITAAITESGLRNLDHGDRDSLGLFQQRPSQGWGTPTQIMNPTYSTTQFYRHLLAVHDWQQMSVNDAAQAVERSGFPRAYAPHEQTAREIVGTVHGVTCATSGRDCDHIQAPNSTALAAINYACGQRGLPYVWGGNGAELTELPEGQTTLTGGFDCSGLTRAAYATAGIQIPRTAQAQFNTGPQVPPGQPILPGDLVFYGTNSNAVTHVGIAISHSDMINAPHQGTVVRIEKIGRSNLLGATRPAATRAR